MSAPAKTRGTVEYWPDPAGGVYTVCRCGERVRATGADTVAAMLAGHWMFDASHAEFVAVEAVRGTSGALSDADERADYLGIEP